MVFLETLNNFLQDCTLRGRTKRTVEGYRSSIKEFLEYYPQPEKVTKYELKNYLAVLQARDLKMTTIKGYFSAMSSFYEYLIYEERIQANPILPFRARYLDKTTRYDRRQLLSVDKMRQLINSIKLEFDNIQDIAMLVTLAKTGARKQEFLDLQVKDIDFKRMMIKLPDAAKRNNRFIPMDLEFQVILEEYLKWRKFYARADVPYLWITQRGGRVHKDYPNELIAYHAEPLGLHEPRGPLEQRLTCHCFRKWFTHHLVKNGMTEIYMQILRGDSLKDAAWKDNYLEPEDLIDFEIRQEYLSCMPPIVCY